MQGLSAITSPLQEAFFSPLKLHICSPPPIPAPCTDLERRAHNKHQILCLPCNLLLYISTILKETQKGQSYGYFQLSTDWSSQLFCCYQKTPLYWSVNPWPCCCPGVPHRLPLAHHCWVLPTWDYFRANQSLLLWSPSAGLGFLVSPPTCIAWLWGNSCPKTPWTLIPEHFPVLQIRPNAALRSVQIMVAQNAEIGQEMFWILAFNHKFSWEQWDRIGLIYNRISPPISHPILHISVQGSP